MKEDLKRHKYCLIAILVALAVIFFNAKQYDSILEETIRESEQIKLENDILKIQIEHLKKTTVIEYDKDTGKKIKETKIIEQKKETKEETSQKKDTTKEKVAEKKEEVKPSSKKYRLIGGLGLDSKLNPVYSIGVSRYFGPIDVGIMGQKGTEFTLSLFVGVSF